MEVFVRIVLGILILFSFLGAVDDWWRSPTLLALPVLGAVCWVLASRIAAQEKKIRELEHLLRAQFREQKAAADSSSMGAAAHAGATTASARSGSGRQFAAPTDDEAVFGWNEGADPGENFTFSAQEEISPAAPSQAVREAKPAAPEWLATAWSQALAWITGGNPVVKVGLVVLFFGVSFLLKYASDHSLLPVELRMAGAGMLGVALLALGWRLRHGNPVYALLVQGGGVGVLYLTIFAAARFLDMIPPLWALILMCAVVVFSGILAVLQNASALAVFGAAGGFLAPILLSTGQGSHVQLFGYYALLNLGVLGVAWYRTWRVLNLLGFACTFGIGALWGARFYAPEYFATTEPFLILFFLMYGTVSILFARANSEQGRTRLDSALVFGLPLAAFGLQMALVRDMEMGGAFSCLGLALWYILPLKLMWKRSGGLGLLAEAHLALGVIFLSLAVPMALDASWTASTWALEGAGMIWLGLRQKRLITRIFGLLLQIGAAVAFAASLSLWSLHLNEGHLLAGLFLGLGGFFSSWSYWACPEARLSREEPLPLALGLWGAVWWYGTWFFWAGEQVHSDPIFLAATLGTLGVWAVMHRRTLWFMPRHLAQFTVVLLLCSAVLWSGHPAADWGWIGWPLALLAQFGMLFALEESWDARVRGWVHTLSAILVAVLALREVHRQVLIHIVQSGSWADAAAAVTGVLLLIVIVFPRLDWPLRRHFAAYLRAGGALAAFLVLWWIGACFVSGNPRPLPYVPILNPLDLTQALVLVTVAFWARKSAVHDLPGVSHAGRFLPAILGAWAFVWMNVVVARAVHFLGDVPYAMDSMFRSDVLQAAYSVLWSLAALGAMLLGRRRALRQSWLAGAGLLAVVVGKLFLIDLDGRGTVARIVSFLGVGLLMLVVGYFCPLPPKGEKS
jgi:uncharacterized membrane protein